jgi:molybdopterin/thiamine biosynthesis adenylyltransferase/rhodanese-related sulfurtransferase
VKLPPSHRRGAQGLGTAAHESGALEPDELRRYARQIRLPSLGVDGQLRLKAASVLIVGAGGLGSPAATYLAAAGVGRIGVADDDRVDASNLHRQPLHRTEDIGLAKADSARETLAEINPHVRVDAIKHRVSRENALDLVAAYDVVIDGTDNFPTRYLLNDACVLSGRPLVYGSVDRFEGQVSLFATERGPCYRCLFPSPPEPGTVQNCADAGVLGVLPGLVGTLQATEALKLILGLGETLAGRLLLVDALSMRFRTIGVDRDPECPACGTREIDSLIDYEAFCAGEQPVMSDVDTILPSELSAALNAGESIVVVDVREPYEWQIGRIPSARLIPLGTLFSSPADIPLDADIVVYCHHGQRSHAAAEALSAFGFRRVRNLVGGIDRWSREVDPGVRRY